MAHNQHRISIRPMSQLSQTRYFGGAPTTSGLPPAIDNLTLRQHVSNVPICDIARERRGLIEGHADPLLLAPDNVTGNVRTVSLKDKVETLGNFVRVRDIERRP